MELITRYWRVHFNYVSYARARFAYYANNFRNSLMNLFRARNASVNFHYLLSLSKFSILMQQRIEVYIVFEHSLYYHLIFIY